ncbi:MAG TPA: response regulator transcription factor [Humisphaera sp.]
MAKTKVMLVDDHALLRSGVRGLVDRQPDFEVVAEASTAADAAAAADRARPELVVLDMTLPGGGSLGLQKQLADRGVRARVLVLSTHDDPAYARAAIAAGATGYVVKTISEPDLLAAMRSVRRGLLIVDLDDDAKTASVFGEVSALARQEQGAGPEKLSEREAEVLALIGQGHSNQSVSEMLDISPKTVATYKARIGEKLGLRTTPDFVKYVANAGHPPKPATPE